MTDESQQLRHLLDRAAIIDAVIGFANAFDAQDWERLRASLCDELHTDYSEFRGEAPALVSAKAYVEARSKSLSGLKTLHLSTNHEIEVNGDRAICRSAYRIFRVNPALTTGENRLDTAGHYEHQMLRTPLGWRICGIRQTVVLQEGLPQVHGAFRASEASASTPTPAA